MKNGTRITVGILTFAWLNGSLTKGKIRRFLKYIEPQKLKRYGECRPDQCETLSGDKKNACCKLENKKCNFLDEQKMGCKIYEIRPFNCRMFPNDNEDLKLVKNCSYYFK